jgi:sulfoxide reductase heme-binding subunit YedZ
MLTHRLAKPLFFVLCLGPFLWIVWNAFFGDLGANPVETVTHQTGDWALRLLLVTLALTPLKNLTANSGFIRFRRMSGLFVYLYAVCHFSIWFIADHSLDVASMLEDILERPYITLGFLAFLLLTPLAMTSNRRSIRKLGKRWKSLHRLVYFIVILALAHFIWLVKADYLEPLIYAVIAAVLLIARLGNLKSVRLFQTPVKSA